MGQDKRGASWRSLARGTTGAGLALLAIVAAGRVDAAETILDFSGDICGESGTESCGNGTRIGQSYGDTAVQNVSYRSFLAATGATSEDYLKFWAGGYGDLSNVVWGGTNPSEFTAEIVITPIAGYEVSLTGFLAGCYQNRASCQTSPFSVTTLSGATLGGGTIVSPGPDGHATIGVNSSYVTDGIVLRWGPDSYDTGLDDIRFDVRAVAVDPGAVPEPASWAMMIGGFAATGAAMRRRRTAVRVLA